MTRRVEQIAHARRSRARTEKEIARIKVGTERLKPYQWKPGQSGNPEGINTSGKPSIVKLLYQHLMRYPEDGEAIIKALISEGKMGNIVATKEILDRVDGKVPETHKVEGTLPVTIQFIPAEIMLGTKDQLALPPVEQGRIIEGQVREIYAQPQRTEDRPV